MKEITLRELLRKPKDIFPIPSDGILVLCRDRVNFYIYPMACSSTVEQVPVKNEVASPNLAEPAEKTELKGLPEPEHLWDDNNLMPVYKQGVDNQFCLTWHQKGLKQRVYPVKKFRPDGSLDIEGRFCRTCIEGFLKQDGHLE